jgi:hypothetical protein
MKGVSIKILMIDPYGHAASLRSESVSKNPSSTKDIDVRLQVKACLHELNEIAETLGDQGQKYKDCLRVKLYRTLPSVSIYSTKGLTLVGTMRRKRLRVRNLPYQPRHLLWKMLILKNLT